MLLSDLASLGSFVSGIAVLVSLIYLGLQTRQNVRHTMALIQQGRSGQTGALLGQIATVPSLAAVMVKAGEEAASLSEVEAFRLAYWYYAMFLNLEDQIFQHRQGLIDDARFNSTLAGAHDAVRSAGGRVAWKMLRRRFHPSFQTVMDDIVRDTPPARSMRESWQRYALDEARQHQTTDAEVSSLSPPTRSP